MFDKLMGGGEGTFAGEMQSEVLEGALELAMPKILKMIKPFVEPGLKKLSTELGDDEKILLLRKDKETGILVFFVIETNTVKAFELTANPKVILPIDKPLDFIEKLIKGDIMTALKDDAKGNTQDNTTNTQNTTLEEKK